MSTTQSTDPAATLSAPGLDALPAATPLVSGSLRRTLLMLALPVLAEQLLNSFVGMFDTYLAGRLDTASTNAVGLAAYVSWGASLIFSLVAVGTTALVSRFVGARQIGEANHICNQSLTLAFALGLMIALIVFAAAPWLAQQQNMTGRDGHVAIQFLRYDVIGYAFMSLTLAAGAAMRGAGDMRTPMVIYVVINILNVIVSRTLALGAGPIPPWGVTGIVTGTVVARTLGGLLALAVLIRGQAGLKVTSDALRLSRQTIWRMVRIGLPAAGDGAVMWLGQFLFLRIISMLDDTVHGKAMYAAHIIAIRIESLSYLPALAWATATATLVGQAIGAGDPRRAKRVGHEAVIQAGALILGVATCYYIFADDIFRLMHKDPLVHDAGVAPFRVLAFFQPCLAISIVYIGALRGAGNTRTPLMITLVGMIALRLPLGYAFGILHQGGLIGAWIGMFSDMTWRALAGAVVYAAGRWLRTRV